MPSILHVLKTLHAIGVNNQGYVTEKATLFLFGGTMQIGIPKESLKGERRVAATPSSVEQLKKLGFSVVIESGAGLESNFNDAAYIEAGAQIQSKKEVWASDIVLKINAPIETEDGHETDLLTPNATLLTLLFPAQNDALLKTLAEKKVNSLAMDMVPRISRAQSMDVLSSMANIAGYRAVVEAAHHFGRFFTGQITAAGKVPPAKVLIIGAGVAGLAAIGAAGSLGAEVRAFDTRPEVKEQINSMGAEFLEVEIEEEAGSGDGYAKVMSKEFIDAEMALFRQQAKEVDIIITTALIPGKPAPKLILKDMVEALRPGSVIVDLAAPNGGNCELTEPGKVVVKNDVTIIGYTDLASRLPGQASQLFSTNLVNLLKLLCKEKDGTIDIDFEDVIIRGVTAVKKGEITFPPPQIQVSAQQQQKQEKPQAISAKNKKEEKKAPLAQASPCSRCHHSLWLDRQQRAICLSRAFHCFCACLRSWLLRCLECHPRPAHTADECNQCYIRDYHRWCSASDWGR